MPEHAHLLERVEKSTKNGPAKIKEALETVKGAAKDLPLQAQMTICSAIMDINEALTQKEPAK